MTSGSGVAKHKSLNMYVWLKRLKCLFRELREWLCRNWRPCTRPARKIASIHATCWKSVSICRKWSQFQKYL